MTRRKVSNEQNGAPSTPRARKATSAKKEAETVVVAPRARRSARAKSEGIRGSVPTDVEFLSAIADRRREGAGPTEVGVLSRNADMVRERAYLLAEQNGFAGDPAFYWSLAERELHRIHA